MRKIKDRLAMKQSIVPTQFMAASVIAVFPERAWLQLPDGRPRDVVRREVSMEAFRFEFALGSQHVVHEQTPEGFRLVDFE